MLRSILAQLEYRYQVCRWDSIGVPFRTYLYVPEIHPVTKSEFHEHEDFAHVLKVNSSLFAEVNVQFKKVYNLHLYSELPKAQD